jgi:hypothetical protein
MSIMAKVNPAVPSKDLLLPLIDIYSAVKVDELEYLRREELSYDPYFVRPSILYLSHPSPPSLTISSILELCLQGNQVARSFSQNRRSKSSTAP